MCSESKQSIFSFTKFSKDLCEAIDPPSPLTTFPRIRTWLFNKAKPELDESLASKKEHRDLVLDAGTSCRIAL